MSDLSGMLGSLESTYSKLSDQLKASGVDVPDLNNLADMTDAELIDELKKSGIEVQFANAEDLLSGNLENLEGLDLSSLFGAI